MILREYLQNRYREIRLHHDQGATGEQVMAALTDLSDEVIERIYKEIFKSLPAGDRWKFEDGLSIVALGGYGRGELAPFSDIDIMLLHRRSIRGSIKRLAGDLLQNLWDVGFKVGHSTRTVDDCVVIGNADLTVRTSMMEARFLSGSRDLFDRFRSRYRRKVILHRPDLYAKAKIRGRLAELEQYGTTTHLLEPHIKKSLGGLRNIHLLRWLAQNRYHTASLDLMKQQGILSKQDHLALTEAEEFLWQIRNEMHFYAGRCQDSLTFEEQVRLAERWEFKDMKNLLAVEQFMQRYYDHTTAIAEISDRYIKGMAFTTLWSQFRTRLARRTIGKSFRLAGGQVSILPESRGEVLDRPERLLALFRLSQAHNARLSFETQDQLMERMRQWKPEDFQSEKAGAAFLSILKMPTGVSETLRVLHRFRILEQIIPDFARVRGLMQFNVYHKYTVDEHCLRAVEEAEKMRNEGGPAGQVFSEIHRREILFLSLLLHDLGKGLDRDHSKEGAAMALGAATRLGFDRVATEQLQFLVLKHLVMTHVAFRRDLADDGVLVRFAKTVATPETLKMLYVLTLADVTAVGPGTLTAWKKDLLTELYTKTLDILTGGAGVVAEEEKVKRARESIQARLKDLYDPVWMKEQLSAMSTRYLIRTPLERIVRDLERVHELLPKTVKVYADNDSERKLTEYSVYTFDDVTPGIFSKITAVLAAKGLQVLDATITTWRNNVVLDTFQVQDPDYSGSPSAYRLQDVQKAILDVLLGQSEPVHPGKVGLRVGSGRGTFPIISPVQVEIDNDTSEKYTVIEVFAHDQPGLLAVIAQSLFTQQLSVHWAKVATRLDQVVDVFHVTDEAGQKIVDPDRIRQLKQSLPQEIERLTEISRVQ